MSMTGTSRMLKTGSVTQTAIMQTVSLMGVTAVCPPNLAVHCLKFPSCRLWFPRSGRIPWECEIFYNRLIRVSTGGEQKAYRHMGQIRVWIWVHRAKFCEYGWHSSLCNSSLVNPPPCGDHGDCSCCDANEKIKCTCHDYWTRPTCRKPSHPEHLSFLLLLTLQNAGSVEIIQTINANTMVYALVGVANVTVQDYNTRTSITTPGLQHQFAMLVAGGGGK